MSTTSSSIGEGMSYGKRPTKEQVRANLAAWQAVGERIAGFRPTLVVVEAEKRPEMLRKIRARAQKRGWGVVYSQDPKVVAKHASFLAVIGYHGACEDVAESLNLPIYNL